MQQKRVFESIVEQISAQNYAIIQYLNPDKTLRGLYQQLQTITNNHQLSNAGIGAKTNYQKNEAIRSDQIHWIDEQRTIREEKDFLQRIGNLSDYLNRTCYTGIRGREFHYARFETGAFYKRHIDRFNNDNARKFSVITYLNPQWNPDFGGELVLYLNNQTISVLPEWGCTVIFPSHLIEHEVLPASQPRLSLTGWLK